MGVYWVSPRGLEPHKADEIAGLLAREEGFVWLDIPECDAHALRILSGTFRFHPLALQDCTQPGHMPKIHAYSDHIFLMLQVTEPTDGQAQEKGQIYRRELNQFIGRRFLVTVHEGTTLTGTVDTRTATRQTRAVLERIQTGRFCPGSPAELSYAIVSALARHMEGQVSKLASRVAELERLIMTGQVRNTDPFLEELFRLRHELLTVRTVAAQNREMYLRMASLAPRYTPPEDRPYIEDVQNQLERIQQLCDEERDFLEGVLDYYQTRSTTKIQFAMQRMAFITALALPVTAVASIYGMNVIVNTRTEPLQLLLSFVLMGLLIGGMLWWSRKQGWW
jgi:Mg2+ and Co2+ transporter CorA